MTWCADCETACTAEEWQNGFIEEDTSIVHEGDNVKDRGLFNDNGNWVTKSGSDEWLGLFGDTPLVSQYQDGHFVYQVVAGDDTGDDSYPPVLYVADIENASHFNSVLEP